VLHSSRAYELAMNGALNYLIAKDIRAAVSISSSVELAHSSKK